MDELETAPQGLIASLQSSLSLAIRPGKRKPPWQPDTSLQGRLNTGLQDGISQTFKPAYHRPPGQPKTSLQSSPTLPLSQPDTGLMGYLRQALIAALSRKPPRLLITGQLGSLTLRDYRRLSCMKLILMHHRPNREMSEISRETLDKKRTKHQAALVAALSKAKIDGMRAVSQVLSQAIPLERKAYSLDTDRSEAINIRYVVPDIKKPKWSGLSEDQWASKN